jgi:cyclopropane fatty-acyl-phospholipid synthase-like methyltransferase
MPSGGTLLDVGCGAGQVATYLVGAFNSVVAINPSVSMLTAARARIAEPRAPGNYPCEG